MPESAMGKPFVFSLMLPRNGTTMKLNAKTIAALTLDGKRDAIFFDDTLKGFGYRLREGADGRVLKSWIVQYRRAGASRRMLLGDANVLNAEAARAKAKKALGDVWKDIDPQAAKVERRVKDKVTMRTIIDQYIADKTRPERPEWRPQTKRDNARYLTGDYFKPLHGLPIDKIGRRDVATRLIAIKNAHSAIVAHAARSKLSAFFSWTMRQGLRDDNPVIGTDAGNGNGNGKPRERVLSDAELAAIWRGCNGSDHGKIIRLLILLGARRQEIGGMAWSELNLDAPQRTWTLPAERSKNRNAHTLPLMPAALDIIKSVPRLVERDQLFGSRSAGGFQKWDLGKRGLDERSGVTEWTVHDIRRTVATRMADIKIAPHIIEEILNHRGGHRAGVAGVYNRSSYSNEVRTALVMWSDHIRTLVEGGKRKIVPMRQVP
jgi:integrase